MSRRKILGAILALACVALLSSCSLLPSIPVTNPFDSSEQPDAVMKQIASAVKHHDAAALKKLFSSRAREKASDLDGGLKYFLSFFPTGKMTWKYGDYSDAEDGAYGKKTVEMHVDYTVFSNGKKYDVYFADFPINQVDDPKNVGIYALGVAPYTANKATASGATKPYYVWTGSFQLVNGEATGIPGVYIPQK